ncbi:MAG: hypothetical protein WCL00_06070 [Bacteroidota bacterium]
MGKTEYVNQSWISKSWDIHNDHPKWYPCFYEQKQGERIKRVSFERGLELIKQKELDMTERLHYWLMKNGYESFVKAL